MKFDYPDDSLTLHTDAYELSMMQTYWKKGMGNRRAVFEAFFRKMPFNNGYAVFAGLDHIIRYVKQLHFTDSDIEYLKSTNQFDDDFLEYLRNFKFTGSINSFEEGDLVFNHEPIIQVDAPIIEGQLIETAILNILNYQIMIATKASRIKSIVGNQTVMEFGSRRAQELDAALWGTRAAYIGGFDATSNVRAGKLFGIPISGTHAHALVQVYMNDYDAFKAYAETHHDCVFLVDTFDTLKSGVPNAIKVAKEFGDKINFIGNIEVTSGPAMGFTGTTTQESAGGLVNLISKRAGDEDITKFKQTFSGRGSFGEYVDVSRRFGKEKEWGLRINAQNLSGETAIPDEKLTARDFFINLDHRDKKSNTNL